MATTKTQLYEVPIAHFLPAIGWLRERHIAYFNRLGFTKGYIQVITASSDDLEEFYAFLGNLFVIKVSATFPRKHRKLVEEELKSWSIDYKVVKNPFVFEIEAMADERIFSDFVRAMKVLTKNPNRWSRKKKASIPEDIASLL